MFRIKEVHLIASKLEKGLPAISLNAHSALVSAVSNDIGGDFIYAQQVIGYGRMNDVLLGNQYLWKLSKCSGCMYRCQGKRIKSNYPDR